MFHAHTMAGGKRQLPATTIRTAGMGNQSQARAGIASILVQGAGKDHEEINVKPTKMGVSIVLGGQKAPVRPPLH